MSTSRSTTSAMSPFDGKHKLFKSHNPHFLLLRSPFSEILTFQMYDLVNLGQGHRVQHSYLSHSVANTNLYKSQTEHFTQALTVSEISNFELLDLE